MRGIPVACVKHVGRRSTDLLLRVGDLKSGSLINGSSERAILLFGINSSANGFGFLAVMVRFHGHSSSILPTMKQVYEKTSRLKTFVAAGKSEQSQTERAIKNCVLILHPAPLGHLSYKPSYLSSGKFLQRYFGEHESRASCKSTHRSSAADLNLFG